MAPTSIIDLQKQVEELSIANRNLKWFTISMFLIVIAVYTLSANWKTVDPHDAEIQALRTAIQVQQAADSIIVLSLKKQETEDSMRTATLLMEIAGTKTTLANITKRYDIKRNTVSSLSDSDQLRMLSDNITSGH